MIAQRKTNVLRDSADRASSEIVRVLDQARAKVLKADLVGAGEEIRTARQHAIKLCLKYETQVRDLQASLARAQSSVLLAERQLKSMQSFSGKPEQAET